MTEQQQDESKLERVIRKIKRCWALSKSSNENEAATAIRQAQALMREYRLTELDVRLSDVDEVQSENSRVNRWPAWDRHLSGIVARVFGCRPLTYKQWCESSGRIVERALFVGVMPAPQIAMYAYETLLTKLMQTRRDYVASVRSGTTATSSRRRRSAPRKTTWLRFASCANTSRKHQSTESRLRRWRSTAMSRQHRPGRTVRSPPCCTSSTSPENRD